MLLESMANSDQIRKDQLKLMASSVIEKIVTYMDNPSNDTVLFGDDLYSGQIYLNGLDNTSMELAINNSMAIFNITECKLYLEKAYGISDVVFVSNTFHAMLNTDDIDSYKILAYNGKTKEPLDLSLCKDIHQEIQIPLDLTDDIDMTKYAIMMEEQGIDIFNPDDPAFHDRCAVHIDNTTGKDTTVNWRVERYFQQKTPMCIGFNCTYLGINEYNYIRCNCTGLNSRFDVVNKVVQAAVNWLSEVNLGIVACNNLITLVRPIY
jgi:hypothetical protein